MADNFVLITGCSGGGKSTLLTELARLGHATVEEPGRRVVRAQKKSGGSALPWLDMAAFKSEATALALADRTAMRDIPGWVFFDRGLIDTSEGIDHMAAKNRYHRVVFVAPPWEALFSQDDERRHGFAEAVEEYDSIVSRLPRLNYEIIELPKTGVSARVAFVLRTLGDCAA